MLTMKAALFLPLCGLTLLQNLKLAVLKVLQKTHTHTHTNTHTHTHTHTQHRKRLASTRQGSASRQRRSLPPSLPLPLALGRFVRAPTLRSRGQIPPPPSVLHIGSAGGGVSACARCVLVRGAHFTCFTSAYRLCIYISALRVVAPVAPVRLREASSYEVLTLLALLLLY
jgi:hypothetical protein